MHITYFDVAEGSSRFGFKVIQNTIFNWANLFNVEGIGHNLFASVGC